MPDPIVPNRYPLSTPNGSAIPLDIIKPVALLRQAFTSSDFSTKVTLDSPTYEGKIFVVTSSEDAYISFSASPTTPVSGTVLANVVFVPADVTIALTVDLLDISVKGVTEAGTMHIQIVETWAGLAIAAQINRI